MNLLKTILKLLGISKSYKSQHKYFILTDERSGGTVFTNLFETTGLKVIHDPQTKTKSRLPEFDGNTKSPEILDYCYSKYDVVKCCLISFSSDQYKTLIDYCVNHDIKIIILYRDNFYRSLSKVIAAKLNHYNRWDKLSEEMKNFTYEIKENELFETYTQNYIKYNSIVEYINNINTSVYYINFASFYDKNMGHKLFTYLGLNIMNSDQFKKFMNYDYGTKNKYNNILNIDYLLSQKEDLSKTHSVETIKNKIKWHS